MPTKSIKVKFNSKKGYPYVQACIHNFARNLPSDPWFITWTMDPKAKQLYKLVDIGGLTDPPFKRMALNTGDIKIRNNNQVSGDDPEIFVYEISVEPLAGGQRTSGKAIIRNDPG